MLKNIIKTKISPGSSWILTLAFLFVLVLFGVFFTDNKAQAACSSACQSVANSIGWSSTCSTYSRYCNTCSQCQTCSPVNGGWSSWSNDGSCGQYQACKQKQTRTCTNPSPSCGGSSCSGSSEQYVDCGRVDGGWSSWTAGSWSTCSVSCGGGTQSRTWSKSCTNPSPACGGSSCTGNSTFTESQSCNTQSCCTDNGSTCNYSDSCDTTGTNNCGTEVSRCNRTTRVDGGWSSNTCTGWGNCTVSCGGGTQSRTCSRTCNNPSPSCGGSSCTGSSSWSESQYCNTQACAVNGSCGGAAKNYSASDGSYSGSFCSSGTASPSSPSFPGTGGSSSWTCNGSGGGTNASCAAYRAPEAPSLSVSPSSVTSGNDATFSWNAPSGATSYALKFYRDNTWDSNYTWVWSTSRAINTAGLNSTIGALVWACSNNICSSASNYAGANIVFAVNGACGSAATSYPFNANSWIGSFCSSGSPSPSNPSFPAPGDSTTWSCSGSNGGSAASCRGSRAPVAVNLTVNNGRVAAGTNVVFSWNNVNGATSYGVKYYRDSTWDANYTWVYTNSATFNTTGLNSVAGALVWACSNYTCSTSSNYAAAEIVPSSPDIPMLSVSPTQNIVPGQNALFSWNSVAYASNYYIGYRRDGVWDTSWTSVGQETSVYFNTRNLTQSVGAEVIACHEFGCSARSNQAIATMLARPASPAITVATPPSVLNNGSYTVYMGGRYNYVRWNWTAVSGINGYRLSEQRNNGAWGTEYAINKNTTDYGITLDPDLRGVNKVAIRVRACNDAGCGNWATSQDVNIALAPPSEIPSVQSLSTSSNSNSTNLSSNSDPIYKAITNNGSSPAIFRIEITDNTIGAAFSIVDSAGNAILQDVRTLNNEIYMKVPVNQTYYLKISGTNAGQVQYRFKRYNNYPPYQGQ